MRRIIMVALACMVGATFHSVKAQQLKNEVDTLSYAIGMAQTQGLKEYLATRLNVDTTYIDDFVKGLTEGANTVDDKKKTAYFAGVQIGQQVGSQMMAGINRELFGNDSTQTISKENLMAGFVSAVSGKNCLMTMETAQATTERLMESIKEQTMEKQYGDNKKAGEDFLAKNAKQKGVKTLESGVQYKVLQEGKGEIPTATQKVKVHYEGKLIDGTEFDSSYKRGEPAEFRGDQVIKGWTEALTHMPVGSIWEVYIPQGLAYGSREQGNIKPFSTLIFKIELLEIIDK